jgi:hypothetical protein
MKRNILPIGVATAALALGTTLSVAHLLARPAQAQAVNFFCGSDGVNPVTYASTARGNVPIVRWRSNYFTGAGYTPERRCQEVSGRFQTYYNNGTLNYITTGIMNGQPVVCTSGTTGGGCAGLLFTLRPNDNASQVVQQLFDIRSGAAGPINQSGDRPYIDVQELLDTRAVEGEAPAATTPAVDPLPSEPAAQPSTPAAGGGNVW